MKNHGQKNTKFTTNNGFRWDIPTDLKVAVREVSELRDHNYKVLLPIARQCVQVAMPELGEVRKDLYTGNEFTYLNQEGERIAKNMAFVSKGSLKAYEITWITQHLLKGERQFETIELPKFKHVVTGLVYNSEKEYTRPMAPHYEKDEVQAYFKSTGLKLSYITNNLMLNYVNACLVAKAIDDHYLDMIRGEEPEPETETKEVKVNKVKKSKKIASNKTEAKVESEIKTEEVKVEENS